MYLQRLYKVFDTAIHIKQKSQGNPSQERSDLEKSKSHIRNYDYYLMWFHQMLFNLLSFFLLCLI